jgi:hypothetical protein
MGGGGVGGGGDGGGGNGGGKGDGVDGGDGGDGGGGDGSGLLGGRGGVSGGSLGGIGIEGGNGGGGAQSAESPAKSRLRPVHVPFPIYETENVASIYPSSGVKKNCTPLDACSSERDCGSVGLSELAPRNVPVKVFVLGLK